MTFAVSDIVKQVRVTLDQNQLESPLIEEDEATLEMDEIIRQKIGQAAFEILREAPLPWIDTTKSMFNIDRAPIADKFGIVTLELPGDFLRLSYAKASDWVVPVRVAVTDMDDDYKAAFSKFSGIRPNRIRPMVTITGEAKKFVEFRGSQQGATLDKAEYIAVPEIGEDDTLDFPSKLETSLYYLTAALTALTYKDAQAQSLFAMARQYMGIPEQPQQQPQK